MLTAVILAAGAGTRLGEIGKQYSKPTVPVAGRPLIAWIFDMLTAAGIDHFVVVGHPSDRRLEELVRPMNNAILVWQAQRLGIADALRCALPQIADQPAYLACACDSLYRVAEVDALIAAGRAAPGAAVVGVLDMGVEATASRSAVRIEGKCVIDIVEKPAPGTLDSGLVALPLYWLPAAFASYVCHGDDGRETYISTALSRFAHEGGRILAAQMSERLEITTPSDLEHVERELSAPQRWISRGHL